MKMRTRLNLLSPSNGFILGSSTAFEGLEKPSTSGLVTTGYQNGDYSLLTASWSLGLTVCLLQDDGTPFEIPEGVLAILPDVPEVKVVGPVIRIPSKSITLKEEADGLIILDNSARVIFKIRLEGDFAFITDSDTSPQLTDWHYLMQASSALKRIIDAGVGKSEHQQKQLLLQYHSEINRIAAGFGGLCDSIKEPRMCQIRVYRLNITVFGKTITQRLYQKENDYSEVQQLFETAFRKAFPDISSLAIFVREVDFFKNSDFGVEVDVDYLNLHTYLSFNLQISSIILPERAASALSLNTVFQDGVSM